MTVQVLQVDPVAALLPYDVERRRIEAAGGAFVVGDCKTEADVLEQARNSEILLLSWLPIVTARVMADLPRLRLVVRWGVGFDQIDAQAATELGIAVANAPTYCTDEVAEHAIALLVAAARRVAWYHETMRDGGWPTFGEHPMRRIRGRTLGLIGLGRIGSAVAARAHGLGLRVIACDPHLTEDIIRQRGAEPRALDALLAEADFVSVHVNLSAETYHLLNEGRLRRMRPDATLINTSRGPVVDEAALARVLETGHLAGAALDVYQVEPLAADSSLRRLPNVLLTPHSASWSAEAWEGLRAEVSQVAVDWIETSWCRSVVNPEVRTRLRPRRAA